jgi:beta-fructofuranosidase
VHFTPDEGWINDPYGVVWVRDRYHLFYQAVPGQVVWGPNAHWGHAESADLIHWTERPIALTPQEYEVGCWSGSVVADAGTPRLFYTRVVGEDWSHGVVATATGDSTLTDWTTGETDVVVGGPPADPEVRVFRDPFVFRHGGEWVMIVGAALADGSGGAVQYRSSDLLTWTSDGLLCTRQSTPDDEVWTGNMWECPQLFPLEDQWVLLVSVWHEDTLHHVAAGIGDYDGRKFVPHTWQQLTYGSCAYAMTAFADRDGKRCVLSWLREEPQNNPELAVRASAHSVPAVIALAEDGRLTLSPHPNLYAQATELRVPAAASAATRLPLGERAVQLTFAPHGDQRLAVTDGDRDLAVLELDGAGSQLRVVRPGLADGVMPLACHTELRVVIDADLVEVFGAAGYGAFRIGVATSPAVTEVVLGAPHPEATLTVLPGRDLLTSRGACRTGTSP